VVAGLHPAQCWDLLVLDERALAEPFVTHNEDLLEVMLPGLEAAVAEQEPTRTVADDVRMILGRRVVHGRRWPARTLMLTRKSVVFRNEFPNAPSVREKHRPPRRRELVEHNLELADFTLSANARAMLTDSRHLDEIFFDTFQVFRFRVHDSLKPYAICCKSYDTKLDSRISVRMSL
jgi:hypothetical protein